MLIQEIVRSCENENVAQAAVASIGRTFSSRVNDVATMYGMSVGAYTALSVKRFARHGDEGEMRSVLSAMEASQEPVLAGLHRILCIMLAAGGLGPERRSHHRMPRMTAQLCVMEADTRRTVYC